jgi:hypothetical protein
VGPWSEHDRRRPTCRGVRETTSGLDRRHQRTPEPTNQRNGARDPLLTTKAGDVELKIPKLRHGSFFPSILERRRRIDRALLAATVDHGDRRRGAA